MRNNSNTKYHYVAIRNTKYIQVPQNQFVK